MEEDKILITNVQRFSLHDGPGIRTTVFLKGCSLRCPWCSNPENLSPTIQEYFKDGLKGTYGQWMTADELVHECLKDKTYYEGKIDRCQWRISKSDDISLLPGGVTFSGGEALLQMKQLMPAIEALHEENIHIAVETALFVPEKNMELAIGHIDLFYVDMKIILPDRCREVEKGDLGLYLRNLEKFMQTAAPVVIRVPVIGTYTDGVENRRAVKNLIAKYSNRILKVELIKEHNLGESKYNSLNMRTNYNGVEESLMERYKTEIDEIGIPVEICRI